MKILELIKEYYSAHEVIFIVVGIIILTFILGALTNQFFKRLIRKASEQKDAKLTNYQFLRQHILNQFLK